MLSKVRNRRETLNQKSANEDDEDTKEFLLNRKVTVKRGVNIEVEYKICEFIGSGKFGDVNRCEEKSTGHELAAKVIPYSCPDEKDAVMNEVEIMCRLRHPRLIQLYDVFIQRDRITLVMELVTGGELFERVIDDNFELDEATCEKFMRQILQGVEYIHSQHVVHLDLKPENILCLSRTGFKIKIIDFGLAREVTNGDLRVMFGTPEFVAPEVISFDPVTYASDMWSVGVVCYVLLSGLSPFMGDNESETLSNIMRCNYTFDYPEFKDISGDAKDFIRSLLNKNPRKRNTATQCLAHSWLKERPRMKRTATVNKKRLRHFVYRRKWQKAVNAIIALQRMGVVLIHTPNKETEYRKLLQARSTKTAALLRKSSIRDTSMVKDVDNVVKQNRSYSIASESTKKVIEGVAKTASADEREPRQNKPPPQISVISPTKVDMKTPGLSSPGIKDSPNWTTNKPPTPKPAKSGMNSPLGEAPPKSTAAAKSPNAPVVTSPTKADGKAPAQKTENPPRANSTQPKSVEKIEPELKTTPGGIVTKTVVNSVFTKDARKSTEKECKSLPAENQNPTSATIRSKPEPLSNLSSTGSSSSATTTPTVRTRVAPGSATPTASGTAASSSNAQPPTSALLKMVSLSKNHGSVADRISFFNNSSPDHQGKSAKSKKFSLYS